MFSTAFNIFICMKKIFLKISFLSILIFNSSFLVSQTNLVINPSFEINTGCPNITGGDLNKATGWDSCRASPDYFNTCASTSYFQIPKNVLGSQYPAHGNAYSGFCSYNASVFYREIVIGQLTNSLTISQKYYISFKVSRADSNFTVGYSTNKIGIKFSKVKQNYVPINNTAHYFTNTVITDTVNWTRISGSFIADSAYNYIMLGNFFDDVNTTIFNHGNGSVSYYYLDEVCVSTDSTFTENYSTGIKGTQHNKATPLIYPNPANDFFIIKGIPKNEITVFSEYGSLMNIKTEIQNNSSKIDCSNWPSGIYFIETKNAHYKIIINH